MIRTGYSFKVATGHLPEVLARIKVVGLPKAPIADRMSTFGFVKWTKLCGDDIQPVYGVEIACVPELGTKRPASDYWCFLAKGWFFVRVAGCHPYEVVQCANLFLG